MYALSHNQENSPRVHFLCSKSRVAPSKEKLITPRLELNAVLFLAKLVSVVKRALRDRVKDVHYWSDSTTTLYWINTPSDNLQTLVANRIAAIQELTHGFDWHHAPSGDNPVDIVFRGSLTEQLFTSKLWWHGPEWLPFNVSLPKQPTEVSRKKNIKLEVAVYEVTIKNEFRKKVIKEIFGFS